jgi:Flp pilus assembly protein TadD
MFYMVRSVVIQDWKREYCQIKASEHPNKFTFKESANDKTWKELLSAMTYNSCEAYFSKHLTMALLFIVVATATVYSGSLRNGFVWDDHDIVEKYHLNTSQSSLPQLFELTDSISGWPKAPFYRPLARATYVIDRQLFGLSPWYYHAENLLLHLANVLLLFLFARNLFREVLPSLLAALLFAIHPGISEPVFAVFARNTLLSFFFMLATMLAFQRGIESSRYRWFLLSALSFLFAALSKEMGVMVLPLIVGYCYTEKYPFKKIVLSILPLLIALVAYCLLRNNAMVLENIPSLSTTGMSSRIIQNIYIIPRYLLLVAWPAKLTVWHQVPMNLRDLAPFLVTGWFVLVAGITALVAYGGKTMKFGLFWAGCLLIPVLGFWAVPGAPMAERHLYGPLAGVSLIASGLGIVLMRKRLVMGSVIVCIIFAVLMACTIARSSDWFNDVTLFQSATKIYPDSVNPHFNLGEAYEKGHNSTAALSEWLIVTQLSPNDIAAHSKVGTYYFRAGRYEEALPHFAKTVAMQPEAYIEKTLTMQPDKFALLNNYGSTLDMLGRSEEAIQQYELALQAVPRDNLSEISRLRDRIELLKGQNP